MEQLGLHTFNGYKIAVDPKRDFPAHVFDPLNKRGPPIYLAKTLDDAKFWIKAYQGGHVWAAAARITHKPT